jgi:hypothetical protein
MQWLIITLALILGACAKSEAPRTVEDTGQSTTISIWEGDLAKMEIDKCTMHTDLIDPRKLAERIVNVIYGAGNETLPVGIDRDIQEALKGLTAEQKEEVIKRLQAMIGRLNEEAKQTQSGQQDMGAIEAYHFGYRTDDYRKACGIGPGGDPAQAQATAGYTPFPPLDTRVSKRLLKGIIEDVMEGRGAGACPPPGLRFSVTQVLTGMQGQAEPIPLIIHGRVEDATAAIKVEFGTFNGNEFIVDPSIQVNNPKSEGIAFSGIPADIPNLPNVRYTGDIAIGSGVAPGNKSAQVTYGSGDAAKSELLPDVLMVTAAPRPVAPVDAGTVDAGTRDAGAVDAGAREVAPREATRREDAGTPQPADVAPPPPPPASPGRNCNDAYTAEEQDMRHAQHRCRWPEDPSDWVYPQYR